MKQPANVWITSGITNRTKVILFKSLVLLVLLYISNTWKLTKGEERKLDVFQMRCLRRLYTIRWQQHVPNREVLERAELTAVTDDIRRRWNWMGTVMRRDTRTLVQWYWTGGQMEREIEQGQKQHGGE